MDRPYPPFSWGSTGSTPRGFVPALIARILAPAGWTYGYARISTQRCLREVKTGELFQLMASGSSSPERERDYLVSTPIWNVHFHAFYSARHFPDAAPVRTREELKHVRVCGILGHNFSAFGLNPGQIDMGATSYDDVMRKLERGRCDVFPYNAEVILGYKLVGEDLLHRGSIRHVAFEDMSPWPLNMLISRQFPRSAELLALVNAELKKLRDSGELDAMFRQYQAPL